MNRLLRFALIAVAVVLPASAWAQGSVLQGGTFTAGRVPMYVGTGSQAVVQDSGPASGGAVGVGLKELLITSRGTGTPPYASQGSGPLGTNFCMYDAPTTNATGYHYFCLDPNANGAGSIVYGAGGAASNLPLSFNVNGSAINASPGTYGSTTTVPVFTVDANGMITSITSVTVSPVGSGISSLTGDVTATGPGAAAATLATVNSNVGSFGSSTAIPTFTVNGKGLITAASTAVVVAPAGTLTGATLASNVLASSLTSVGTIATGVWNGTAITGAFGGTGQTSYTKGDLLTTPGSTTLNKLAVGTDGQVLTADAASTNGVKWAAAGGGSAITSLTGDITGTGPGATATTLATVNGNVGSFGSATQTATFTVNAKGLITAAANATITPAFSSLTGSLACSQTPALTGDVTTSAASCATTIAAGVVTYAKFQTVAASSLIGNATGGTATATGITLGATLAFSGSALQTAAITGDATASANSFATTVVKMQGISVKSGTPSDGQVLTYVTANSRWEPIAAPSGNVPTGGTTGQVLAKASGTDYDTTWQSITGTGTVTSVALTMPAIFSVNTTSCTTACSLSVTLATETANTIWAGPTSGGASGPTFRALVGADLPNPSASTLGGVQSVAPVSQQFMKSISTSGVPSLAQPAASDLSDGTTGTGNVVLSTGPVLVTPVLGVASATSINKVAITQPATGSTLTIADGKTLGVSNTLTFTGTDSSSVAFGTGGTVAYTNVATLSSLTSIGTIGTGVWQGTVIGTAFGGTGAANLNGLLQAGTTNTITVGYTYTPNNLGTISSGTVTLNCALGNYQYLTNNGAFTLAAPSSDCGIDVLITNGASAGSITFSGFTVGSSTGSAYTTTNTNKFLTSTRRVNSVSTYSNYALQ